MMKKNKAGGAYLLIIALLVIGLIAGAKKWKDAPEILARYTKSLSKAALLTLATVWAARAFLLARFAAAAWIGPAALAIAAVVFVGTGGWNVFAAGTGLPQTGGGGPKPITTREECERSGGIWNDGPNGRGCLRVGVPGG